MKSLIRLLKEQEKDTVWLKLLVSGKWPEDYPYLPCDAEIAIIDARNVKRSSFRLPLEVLGLDFPEQKP